MKWQRPLIRGTLIRRYQRFLADVRLETGEAVTCHVPNSGSMIGLKDPGLPVALLPEPKPERRLKWTLELVKADGHWVGVNTSRTNHLVAEALENRRIATLSAHPTLRREVPFGTRSRVDFLLQGPSGLCYVEVKNVTLREDRWALFPDAVTERGAKHLRELMAVKRQGHRAVILFVVNRGDCDRVAAARQIDPAYAELLGVAVQAGVEALAYATRPSLRAIALEQELPVHA